MKLIHYECYILEEDARRREKFLKTSDGRFFLNRQISSYLKKIGRYKNINYDGVAELVEGAALEKR